MKKINLKKQSRTDWKRLKNPKDNRLDYSDIPLLSKKMFARAILRLPSPKPVITIRLDADVLDWFKKQGKGYQTKINAVLKMYKDAQQSLG